MHTAPEGLILFALSAGLLCATTWLVARRLARSTLQLFWLVPACVSLQFGALACALSFGSHLTPRGWMGGQVALFAGALLWARRTPRPEPMRVWASFREWWASAPALALAAAAAALIFVSLSGARQATSPISGYDDRMYHASRVAYWVQNASVLPYPTHNERQVAFAFGSELYFLWPVLFTKCETAGRLVFWLGYPLAALGVHLLAGRAGVREPFRSFAVLLFVSTPIVGSQSNGLAPEIWLAFFQLGTAFWILEAASDGGDPPGVARASEAAGLFLLLALNVKTTAAGLILPAALLPFAFVRRTATGSALRALAAGAGVALLLSGLALNFAGNVRAFGSPFASAGLSRLMRSDLNARQLYIHAVRLPLLLIELPWIPDPLRGRLESGGEALAERIGATQTITPEDSGWAWPGRFRFDQPETARNYSLGGCLWLPGLACALVLVFRGFGSQRAANGRSPLALCTLLALSCLLPVVFGLRWMAGSLVPVRFLVAPWALGIVLLSVLASRNGSAGRALLALAAVVVGVQAIASLRTEGIVTRAALRTPAPDATLDEPFAAIMNDLPSGSRVLLFANQDTRDYPLFRPRDGFSNRVIAWGDEPPIAERIIQRAFDTGATKVVFVASEWLMRGGGLPRPWVPTPMRVAEAIDGLAVDPRMHERPSDAANMRVFDVMKSR